MYTPPEPSVPLDTFYPADLGWQLAITAGMGATALLAYASDAYLAEHFPGFVVNLRKTLGMHTIQWIWRAAATAHLAEGAVALVLCLRRGWYSPLNVFKWTMSTIMFGFASLSKLRKHARQVQGEEEDNVQYKKVKWDVYFQRKCY